MKYIWTLPKKCSFPFKSYILKARLLVSVALSSIVLMDTIDIRNPVFLLLLLHCQVTTRKSRRPPHLRVPIRAVFLHAQFKICRVLVCRHFRKQLLEGIQDLLKSDLKQQEYLDLEVTCEYFLLPLLQTSSLVEHFSGAAKIPQKVYLPCWEVAFPEMLETLQQ